MWNIKKENYVCGVNIKINSFSYMFRIYIYQLKPRALHGFMIKFIEYM